MGNKNSMGCDVSKATNVRENGAVNQSSDGFTENQIDTIRSTWPLLARDTKAHGVRLFLLIFMTEPDIKKLFKDLSRTSEEELPNNSVFQGHVARFMQLVDVIVENLDVQKDEVEKILLMLGAKHATFEGFKEEYFQIYSKCMLEVWESVIGEEFIQEVKDSWLVVFSYITRYMAEGYALYMEEQTDYIARERDHLITPQVNSGLSLQT